LPSAPDLPPLAITALKCQGPPETTNVRHARCKETDRIAVASMELAKCGIRADGRWDGMRPESGESLHGAEFDSEKGRRLFTAPSIASMHVGDCPVGDPDSVAVSYPEFVQDVREIGAKIAP